MSTEWFILMQEICLNCVQAFNGFGFGDAGFQMSFGIGAFPFGLFASVFNVSDGRPPARMYIHLYSHEHELNSDL